MRKLIRQLLGRKPKPYVSQIRCLTPLLDPRTDPAYKEAVCKAHGWPVQFARNRLHELQGD